MFKYINTPKLVAFYLREFSVNLNGEPSLLFKFVFCLCLPFVSETFRKARLDALAIVECTNSADQIFRVLEKLCGATLISMDSYDDYAAPFGAGNDSPDFEFMYLPNSDSLVAYGSAANNVTMTVALNGNEASTVQAYLDLLIPFYVNTTITYQ